MADTPRLDLIGDSHLEYMPPGLASQLLPGGQVKCFAIGGSTIANVAPQVRGEADYYLLSIGTNDAAMWAGTALGRFRDHLTAVIEKVGKPIAFMRSPGAWEPLLGGFGAELTESIDRYADAGIEVVEAAGGVVVDVRPALAPLGQDAFEYDGVHLSLRGYQAITPVLADAVARLRG